MANNLDPVFQNLMDIIHQQSVLIASISTKLQQLEIGAGGGSGNATIEDYEEGHSYERNSLVVYRPTETVYRALQPFTATDFEEEVRGDGTEGSVKLKLVGFESSIVTYGAPPTQEEVNNLPQDTLVAIYSSTDDPYDLT